MRDHAPVVILGAGLTGMATALHLSAPYRLYERARAVGGTCRTLPERGYMFDCTGHLLHLRDATIRAWVLSLLDRPPLRIRRRSRIWSNRVYTRYPFQANTKGLPPEVAEECLLGFLRARDGEVGRTDRPASFEEFILRFMGEGIAKHFMVPYNTKLWGVHPREMSPAWTDRFVPKPTVEEVIAGALGTGRKELGYNAEFLYPRGGIGELPAAMGRRLEHLELGVEPRSVDFRKRRVRFGRHEVGYDWLVSTIPLDSLLAIMPGLPPEVRRAASRLRCTELFYLDVALLSRPRRPFHWIYVPEERYPFYRVGSYTNFSRELAPEGCGSLYVELASRARPRLDRVVPAAIEGLREMGIVSGPTDVAFVKLRHVQHAYVVYDHSYRAALDVIHPFLEENRILSRGRYGAWEYSAMEDALLAGREAARAVGERLS